MSSFSSFQNKEEQLKSLLDELKTTTSNAQDLTIKIVSRKNDIFVFENANMLFEFTQIPVYEPKESVNDPQVVDQINEEHKNFLKEKIDALSFLKKEAFDLQDEHNSLNQNLYDIVEEYSNVLSENIEIVQNQKLERSNLMKNIQELRHVSKQCTERSREIKMMIDLRREAQIAHQSIISKSQEIESNNRRSVDIQKEITNLQGQIQKADSDIADIESRIKYLVTRHEESESQNSIQNRVHSYAVNWENEKYELQNELIDLKQELQSLKKSVTSSESSIANVQSLKTKTLTLIKKWKDSGIDVDVPDKSIDELLDILKNARKVFTVKQNTLEAQVNEVIESNSKLSLVLQRKKSMLEKTVMGFKASESYAKKKRKEKSEALAQQREKILAQINKLKIKEAQKLLNQQC
ncbi:hypothetical protein GPJ56_010491 [Histomonas meleagridis]|uniref:uncharacterized protein n=1 Tax=Histomonas meleagridis TaxID=135588 RepID=UPI00355A2202|nr:hypothetical protein GPJ56_010491 [Histomonas meleagridis]KAH0798032.1 hypothetical protein GO595_009145 [Histomonas meleagridis]